MFDLSIINNAKDKAQKNSDENMEKYQIEYDQALDCLEDFDIYQNPESLKKSAGHLTAALEYKSNFAEPYIYLSAIYRIYGMDDKAEMYLEKAKWISPEHPKLSELKILFKQVT